MAVHNQRENQQLSEITAGRPELIVNDRSQRPYVVRGGRCERSGLGLALLVSTHNRACCLSGWVLAVGVVALVVSGGSQSRVVEGVVGVGGRVCRLRCGWRLTIRKGCERSGGLAVDFRLCL